MSSVQMILEFVLGFDLESVELCQVIKFEWQDPSELASYQQNTLVNLIERRPKGELSFIKKESQFEKTFL